MNWKPVVSGTILFCLSVCAQPKDDTISRLEAVARKYQDIGSYEASAIACRSLEPGVEARVELKLGYASSKFTPPDLPVPMLQMIQMGPFETVDPTGKPVKSVRRFAGPGPHFSFSQVAWRVTNAKLAGTESLTPGGILRKCVLIEAFYEPTNQNINDPVRYWIEPSSNTVWKFQFSEPDLMSKTGEIVRWTVTFNKWIENEPPPQWLIDACSSVEGKEGSALVGHAAADFSGTTTTGLPFQLSKLRGKVVVLDFWATWCGPCNEEMASLERLRNALPQQQVEIWSVTEDKPDLAKRWLAERKRTLPSVFVASGTAFKQYGVEALPTVVVIGPDGNIAKQWIGLRSENDIKVAVQKALTRSK